MYVVFLAGGLASGKSTVAYELESLGAARVDLDALSHAALAPGSPATYAVAQAFGHDLLNPETGVLNRGELARRAFASAEGTARLESLELPFIEQALKDRLSALAALSEVSCAVVEVPLLDRMTPLMELADEVVCMLCPKEQRLARAVARGMDESDAQRRMARQPTDAWLEAHADVTFDSSGTKQELMEQVRTWWERRQRKGWARANARGEA